MTTTPTRHPDAMRLADELDAESTSGRVSNYTGRRAATELRCQHAEITRLTAENKALRAVVAEAVAAEREACEERVEDLYEKIETPYLVDIARAIHACDKA